MRASLCLAAVALALAPAGAAKPPLVRAAPIYWPGPGGVRLHGRMALLAKARGRQPAVLVLGDADRPEIAQLIEAIAAGGFVVCAIRGAASADDARATIGWLATNRYATGRVALLAGAQDDSIAAAILSRPPDHLIAAAGPDTSLPSTAPIPLLRLAGRATIDPSDIPGILAFLKEQLR